MINPVDELVNGLLQEVQHWKGLLALVIKSQGGTIALKQAEVDVSTPFEIVMKRVDEELLPDTLEMEFKLLEGKDEIEAVLGKPSPIIVPK
jgi:hypothetical protein